MIRFSLNIKLLLIFITLLIGFTISNVLFTENEKVANNIEMIQAVDMAKQWFEIIKDQKEIKGIHSDAPSNVPNHFLLGNDFTPITTTLGSINAKEISSNPDFAALIVRYIKELKIQEGDRVGLVISGSFPALAISSLAALQTLNIEVVLMSSLGASSFGANQSQATWIDMENWLIEYGNLKYKSKLVSLGAENDNGLGLSDEGIFLMKRAAKRNNRDLYIPESLNQSINHRLQILKENNIALLINIGGNQAAMGRCSHSVAIPNGLNIAIQLCEDSDRGLIQEINALGIPYINLLNIKELAHLYGMDINPGIEYANSQTLYNQTKRDKSVQIVVLIISALSFLLLRKNEQ